MIAVACALQNSAVTVVTFARALFSPFGKNENRCILLQEAKEEARVFIENFSNKVQIPGHSVVQVSGK